jgi:hypothetical protein
MKLPMTMSTISSKLRTNSSNLFWAGLLLVVIAELVILNRSWALISSVRNPPPPLRPNRVVRVNFEQYEAVVQRIEKAQDYEPVNVTASSPFGVVETETR